MRVLWFSVSPVSFGEEGVISFGWIASLVRVVKKVSNLKLGIAYVNDASPKKIETRDNVTVYPINIHRSRVQLWHDATTYKDIDSLIIRGGISVIDNFKPDIIQVFGTEWCFGLIKEFTTVPIVIHIQGIWLQYFISGPFKDRAKFQSKLLSNILHPKHAVFSYFEKSLQVERAEREEKIIRMNKYFMGRTEWDRSIIQLYDQDAKYFKVNEALRREFIESENTWEYKHRNGLKLISVGTSSLKGIDVILRAAKLLKENFERPFSWEVYGAKPDEQYYIDLTGIAPDNVGVKFMGNASVKKLSEAMLDADIYVHPSFADNSPNSMCEAQCLGLPVIATNAGGIVSLLPDDYDRDLIAPTHDPYYLASKIIELSKDEVRMIQLGQKNRNIAMIRHNDANVLKSLMSAYKIIIEDNK